MQQSAGQNSRATFPKVFLDSLNSSLFSWHFFLPCNKTHWIPQSYGSPSGKLLCPGFISKAPESWVYLQIPSVFPCRDATSTSQTGLFWDVLVQNNNSSFAGSEATLGRVPCPEPGLFLGFYPIQIPLWIPGASQSCPTAPSALLEFCG